MVKIEQLLSLSITNLKRLGFIKPGAVTIGRVDWNHAGRTVASVGVRVDTTGESPAVRFTYNVDGSPVDYSAPLRFVSSNLNKKGYYLFVCPATGRSCRKMYLIGGRFVSRFAFPALYDCQARSHHQRREFSNFTAVFDCVDSNKNKYRKSTYRGKLTPYGRKCEKRARRIETATAIYRAELAREESRGITRRVESSIK